MKRTVQLIAAAAAPIAGAQITDYVPERGGSTWTFGDHHVALLGFNKMPESTSVFTQDILDDVVPAANADRVIGLFNGFDNIDESGTKFFASNIVFGAGDNSPFNGLDPFVSATNVREGRVVAAVFVLFEGSGSLSFSGSAGGTDTFSANGSLGEFPFVIPSPASATLLALGIGAAFWRRRGVQVARGPVIG